MVAPHGATSITNAKCALRRAAADEFTEPGSASEEREVTSDLRREQVLPARQNATRHCRGVPWHTQPPRNMLGSRDAMMRDPALSVIPYYVAVEVHLTLAVVL